MKTYFTLITLLAALALVGCQTNGGNNWNWNGNQARYYGNAGGDRVASEGTKFVRLIAVDYNFNPSRIRVMPGQRVEVTLVNQGSQPHSVEFELPAGEVEFKQPVSPGQLRTLTFTAPGQSSEYVYYCPVANHHQLGMEGTLIVQR